MFTADRTPTRIPEALLTLNDVGGAETNGFTRTPNNPNKNSKQPKKRRFNTATHPLEPPANRYII